MLERVIPGILLLGLAASLATGPASAQSTNAAPIVIQGAAVDPASLPMNSDGQKAVAEDLPQLKSGALAAHVTAASADRKNWAISALAKGGLVNLAEVARQALEACEFTALGPCLIVEINGHDARDASGGWPTQPRTLDHQGGRFDSWSVPFVSLGDRVTLNGYAGAAAPRALAITPSGSWNWNGGTTIFDAVAAAYAACQKANKGSTCILYAVNDRVVMTP